MRSQESDQFSALSTASSECSPVGGQSSYGTFVAIVAGFDDRVIIKL